MHVPIQNLFSRCDDVIVILVVPRRLTLCYSSSSSVIIVQLIDVLICVDEPYSELLYRMH